MLFYAWKTESLCIEDACGVIVFNMISFERVQREQHTTSCNMIYFGQSDGKSIFSDGFLNALFLFVMGGEKFAIRTSHEIKFSCIIALTWFLSIQNRIHLVVKRSASNMNKFEFKDRVSGTPFGRRLLLRSSQSSRWGWQWMNIQDVHKRVIPQHKLN